MNVVDYTPTPTMLAMMKSNHPVRGIIGPVGSGKSVGCLMECVRRGKMQEPGQDGIRRTKIGVFRNTVEQLKDTTLSTFFEWFPNGVAGRWKEQEKRFLMRFDDVLIEWIFRSMDRPEDVRKLLSLDLSMAYLNEARELPYEVFYNVQSRLGRFPPPKDGVKCTFPNMIFDSNPPDEDSWIYNLGENTKEIELFIQPPGMLEQPDGSYIPNPAAENVENLPDDYYQKMTRGASQEFIDVHVLAKYGASKVGKPVWSEFRQEMHVAPAELKANPEELVVIGMDFGLSPAAVFKQADTWGHVNTIAEAYALDMGLQRFIELKLLPIVRKKFVGRKYRFLVIGDPSGDFRTAITEDSPFDFLEEQGFEVIAAPTNKLDPRINATKELLTVLAGDMRPRFQVSPECEWLIQAMRKGYRYDRLRTTAEKYKPTPDKNVYSHIADANQYADMFYTYGLYASGRYMEDEDDMFMEASGHIVADDTMGY